MTCLSWMLCVAALLLAGKKVIFVRGLQLRARLILATEC
jgi:hypothetical protein